MITFSTSVAMCPPVSVLTSLCIVMDSSSRRGGAGDRPLLRRALLVAPAVDDAQQLEVGNRAGDRGQPERECTVGEHGDHRQLEVDPKGGEGADHAAVDSADA